MTANFECKNKAMALSALEAIAAGTDGTLRAAVMSVKAWVFENALGGLTGETRKKLDEIFHSETEGERKGREWLERGRTGAGPEDGAEWKCVWNAVAKRWEPPFPPPLSGNG